AVQFNTIVIYYGMVTATDQDGSQAFSPFTVTFLTHETPKVPPSVQAISGTIYVGETFSEIAPADAGTGHGPIVSASIDFGDGVGSQERRVGKHGRVSRAEQQHEIIINEFIEICT